MVMSLKQKEIKFKPRIKLTHTIFDLKAPSSLQHVCILTGMEFYILGAACEKSL